MVYVYGEEQPEISTNTGLHLYLGLLCEPSWTGFSASLIFSPVNFTARLLKLWRACCRVLAKWIDRKREPDSYKWYPILGRITICQSWKLLSVENIYGDLEHVWDSSLEKIWCPSPFTLSRVLNPPTKSFALPGSFLWNLPCMGFESCEQSINSL
jgi:hypothetical protein